MHWALKEVSSIQFDIIRNVANAHLWLSIAEKARRRYIRVLSGNQLGQGWPAHRQEESAAQANACFKLTAYQLLMPDTTIVSFQSDLGYNTHVIKETGRLRIWHLVQTHRIHKAVMHSRMSAAQGVQWLQMIREGGDVYSKTMKCAIAFVAALTITMFGFDGSYMDGILSGICAAGMAAASFLLKNNLIIKIFE